jgi:GTP-binding protein Era
MIKQKSCYAVITGKPNVGKSTLLNSIFKRKIAITSYKPHTTRNRIKAIYNADNLSILFMDTPGYHVSRTKLDMFLNSEIKSSYKIADCALLLIDASRPIDDEDKKIIEILQSYDILNVILVITKIDLIDENRIANVKRDIGALIPYKDVVAITCKKETPDLTPLIKTIEKYARDGALTQEENLENDDFIICELVREQIILNTKQEIPYACAVVVEHKEYDKVKNMFTINANIVVDKESQISIILGKNGQMIKKIGTRARMEMLKIFNCHINLKLFVKLEKD